MKFRLLEIVGGVPVLINTDRIIDATSIVGGSCVFMADGGSVDCTRHHVALNLDELWETLNGKFDK